VFLIYRRMVVDKRIDLSYIKAFNEKGDNEMFEEGWIPDRLKLRPKWKGLPIPIVVYIDPKTGEPDFRIILKEKTGEVMKKKLCGLCGQKLLLKIYFIGGQLMRTNRLFNDSPMHRECAMYAAMTCPYIALPSKNYRDKEGDEEKFKIESGAGAKKPEMFLYETSGCKMVTGNFPPSGQRQTFIRANPYIRVIPIKDILLYVNAVREHTEEEVIEMLTEELDKPDIEVLKEITGADILGAK